MAVVSFVNVKGKLSKTWSGKILRNEAEDMSMSQFSRKVILFPHFWESDKLIFSEQHARDQNKGFCILLAWNQGKNT